MKALLYSDWASLRKSMKSFLFSIFMICGIVTFVSGDGVTEYMHLFTADGFTGVGLFAWFISGFSDCACAGGGLWLFGGLLPRHGG